MRLLIAILLSISVQISALEVTLGLYTDHIGVDYLYEKTDLLVIEHNNIYASTFINSYRDKSFSFGGVYKKDITKNIETGIYYGVVTGYCIEMLNGSYPRWLIKYKNITMVCDKKILPSVAPYLKVSGDVINFKVVSIGRAILTTLTLDL